MGVGWKAVELFSGIGGQTLAAEGLVEVVAAWEINDAANATYRHNFGKSPLARDIAGLTADDLLRHGECGWLMSPPCQPFTKKGLQKDVDDPRTQPLLRLVNLLHEVLPPWLLLENVPPFGESRARERLVRKLAALEYHVEEVRLCPTQLRIPNRRERYYLVASRRPLAPLPPPAAVGRPLAEYLDGSPDEALFHERADIRRHGRGMSFVTPDDDVTSCFGSSYGRVFKRAGSHLATPDRRVRRFSPAEILRLLHFPARHAFPPDLDLRTCYRLAGNSVNVACVRYLLGWILSSGSPPSGCDAG